MDTMNGIAEHLTEKGETRIILPILPLMFLISLFVFIGFVILQLLNSKKRVSFLGYIGCGLEMIISIVLVILYISSMKNYMPEGEIFSNSIIIFLLFNISTVTLLIISVLTNSKNKNRRSELEKISINDLE